MTNNYVATSDIPMFLSDKLGLPLAGGRVFPLESQRTILAGQGFEVVGEPTADAWILVRFQDKLGVIPPSALDLASERKE
jgi:hypothetical protein